ncbi:unnamed protein product [Bursaphelenchus okinawaensis]|uniref:Expansin-like protein n=1 Tax=Bursaphelenchus okinawaensis TaxID=465554 RepID=A0A811LLK1_9BILA|nr:unnamed protein product [Bursaphelenchus okinawaensis]CAG9124615.1 unnamed protein product [Bursaphelenchus okinawaensis]
MNALYSLTLVPLVILSLIPLVVSDNISPVLNQPITGGEFTFYGAAGRGACGLDVSSCSAALSGSLFTAGAAWVPSDLPDGRYILDDPICRGICVKIEYQGKTGVFIGDNQCPECAVDHVDLSTDAFLLLEPQGGTVGIAKDATITYLFCNETTLTLCDGSAPTSGTTVLPASTTTAGGNAASTATTKKASGAC